MKIVLIILIVLGALATLFVLVKGVIGMAQGKDMTGQRSQELMRKRVLFQADHDPARHRPARRDEQRRPLTPRWSGSTKSTRAPAMPARPAWSMARVSPRPIRASPRSAMSTRPIARSASPCPRSQTRMRRQCSPASRTNCSISAPTSPPRRGFERRAAHPARPDRAAGARDRRMNEDLEPLRSFILPGGEGGSGRASSRPRGGAARGAGGGRGRGGGVQPRCADLSQPAVGPFVRAGALGGA